MTYFQEGIYENYFMYINELKLFVAILGGFEGGVKNPDNDAWDRVKSAFPALGRGFFVSAADAIPLLKLSHIRVIRPAAAFRRDPVDVLGGVLDVAGFAVDAVLGIDLQPWRVLAIPQDFVHPRRAIALLRCIV